MYVQAIYDRRVENDTAPYQIRWPVALLTQLRALAHQRHSTVAALVRDAVIRQYGLAAPTPDPEPLEG